MKKLSVVLVLILVLVLVGCSSSTAPTGVSPTSFQLVSTSSVYVAQYALCTMGNESFHDLMESSSTPSFYPNATVWSNKPVLVVGYVASTSVFVVRVNGIPATADEPAEPNGVCYIFVTNAMITPSDGLNALDRSTLAVLNIAETRYLGSELMPQVERERVGG